MEDTDAGVEQTAPVWAVFGDLMSGLLGAFVLLLVGVLVVQFEMAGHLEVEVKKRQLEEQRRITLETALAIPLATGRITLNNGRIGISGRVLFLLNSDQLQPEGRALLNSLVAPLSAYLTARDELLMVSGFTDDRSIREGNHRFADNWELSALIDEGMPPSIVFAAAFGAEQPITPNTDETARAQNRRVEMAPVPKSRGVKSPSP